MEHIASVSTEAGHAAIMVVSSSGYKDEKAYHRRAN
jgi:hypothetical protein